MRGHLKFILLLVLIGALVVLLARAGGRVGGLGESGMVSLALKVGFLFLIGVVVVRMFRDRFGEAVQATLVWTALFLVLVAGYTFRFELRDAGERMLAELAPGYAAARGRTVEIVRGNAGDFSVTTQVNGAHMPMILDTGASSVVLTHDAAIAAGLPIEMIKYTVNIDTANGRGQAAAVTLDRIAIGSIVERAVPALIAQPGQLKTNLLGMSFLSRLQSFEVRGDKVVIKGGT